MEITAGTLDELRFDVLSGLGESAWLLGDANGARIALREALLVGKGGERACKVELLLHYGFDSVALAALVGPVFDRIANTFVDSFVQRAESLYGAR